MYNCFWNHKKLLNYSVSLVTLSGEFSKQPSVLWRSGQKFDFTFKLGIKLVCVICLKCFFEKASGHCCKQFMGWLTIGHRPEKVKLGQMDKQT